VPDAALTAALTAAALAAAGHGNPLDLGAGASPAAFADAVQAVAAGGAADALLLVVIGTRANVPAGILAALGDVVDRHPDLPVAAVVIGATDDAPALGKRAAPVFDLPERAVAALGHAVRYAAWRRAPLGRRPQLPGIDAERARALVRQTLDAGGAGWQPYDRTLAVLRAYGIAAAPGNTVHDEVDAVAAARRTGYPVVLKSADPNLVHKTDTGGVRTGVTGDDAVRAAFRQVAAAGRPECGVLVQQQVIGGVELVAGLVHDRLFGSVVMLGLGGVQTDLLDDRTLRLVPLTDLDAGRMWRSLRAAPLLTGYRGGPAVDVAALEDLLLRLGRLAEDLPEIAELDLNPVIAGPEGVRAVDAKLRLAPVGDEPDPLLRRMSAADLRGDP